MNDEPAPEKLQPCGHPVSAIVSAPYMQYNGEWLYSHWCSLCAEEKGEDDAEND